ncbi:predicted protein [Scheffersomyces stipitis CBS 6054]|uniref:Uncharacterized protein n=1 Tax=Scheffersomyces stipitis (strain ATCC 58785 / CBS 6054 / NBRC 10063 / NRRL Y-11545) TaxID=322104 RepID=A3LXN1_PICST|nr:predicted protein [Scheffersomyces stipitis CBS 6054]ABN67493.2 predicted protein [Scheffersomyces stipitis CBS 6054]KAG2732612.1 hypothetical protein G9P44_005029 [Scheffersomyces stipitis]
MSMSEAGELSREELIERVVELETVLSEFQESSKELEQLLEEELQDLERANTTLQSTLDKTNEQLLKSNSRIVELTRELNESQEKAAEKAREQEHRLSEIQQQLVTVEISNDSMESNDRILTNKLDLANQLNNVLLEKLALIENDLEREKKAGIEKRLYISNYQNQVKDLQKTIEILEKKTTADVPEADTSLISIGAVLKEGPPDENSSAPISTIKKSNSLQGIKSLNEGVQAYILSTSTKSLKSSSSVQLTVPSMVDYSFRRSVSAGNERSSSIPSTQSFNRLSLFMDPRDTRPQPLGLSEKENRSRVLQGDAKTRTRNYSHPLRVIPGSPNTAKISNLESKPQSKKKLVYN